MTPPTEAPADSRLRRSVFEAISRYGPIRAMDLDTMSVEAHQGVVTLRGLVASEASRAVAERLARGVRGTKEVVNQLLTDRGLERGIGAALAADPRTHRLRIAVNVLGGVAGLYGAVPTREDEKAVRSVALAVPGVIGVESKLHLVPPGDRVVLAWQNSLEGRPLPPPADDAPVPAPEAPGRETVSSTPTSSTSNTEASQ